MIDKEIEIQSHINIIIIEIIRLIKTLLILACLFLPYFGLIFNESILRGLFEHNLFELAFKQQGLIYYYTLMGQNIKKSPPLLTTERIR